MARASLRRLSTRIAKQTQPPEYPSPSLTDCRIHDQSTVANKSPKNRLLQRNDSMWGNCEKVEKSPTLNSRLQQSLSETKANDTGRHDHRGNLGLPGGTLVEDKARRSDVRVGPGRTRVLLRTAPTATGAGAARAQDRHSRYQRCGLGRRRIGRRTATGRPYAAATPPTPCSSARRPGRGAGWPAAVPSRRPSPPSGNAAPRPDSSAR